MWTVALMSVRKVARLAALSGGSPGLGVCVVLASPAISDGACLVPLAACPATRAMASGLTRTLPSPIVPAAIAATPLGTCMDPEKLGSGSCHGAPSPKPDAAVTRSRPFSRQDRPLNAVPHACAKSAWKAGCEPKPGSDGTFVKTRPPTSFTGWHGTCVLTLRPPASSASVETMVNAGPGG